MGGLGKEGSLTRQRGQHAGRQTSSHGNKAACSCTSFSRDEALSCMMTFDPPHMASRGLGRYCSHFEDEEAECLG